MADVAAASLANLVRAENGNSRGLTHGAYARLRLSVAAGETADTLRELVPLKHDADTAAIETVAFVLEQLRAAGKALKDANAAPIGFDSPRTLRAGRMPKVVPAQVHCHARGVAGLRIRSVRPEVRVGARALGLI